MSKRAIKYRLDQDDLLTLPFFTEENANAALAGLKNGNTVLDPKVGGTGANPSQLVNGSLVTWSENLNRFTTPDTTALGIFQTGDIKPSLSTHFYSGSVDEGWLELDGVTVLRSVFARLFADCGSNPGFGPGDGSTTFTLPDWRGRTLVGAGSGKNTEAVLAASVATGPNTFTVVSNTDKWISGMKVQLTTTGALPAGLSLATDYYVIRDSATTIKFATSLAFAVAPTPTPIDLTTQGTGTHTVTQALTNRPAGTSFGEEAHATLLAEAPTHAHSITGGPGATTNFATINDTSGSADNTILRTVDNDTVGNNGWLGSHAMNNAGGGLSHNNMQPSAAVRWLIKT